MTLLDTEDNLDPGAVQALLARADAHGTSDPDLTLEEVLADNRAGPNEETLTLEQIIDQYAE